MTSFGHLTMISSCFSQWINIHKRLTKPTYIKANCVSEQQYDNGLFQFDFGTDHWKRDGGGEKLIHPKTKDKKKE